MENKKVIQEFEAMIKNAKLNGLQKTSLERPLTASEFEEFKRLAEKN